MLNKPPVGKTTSKKTAKTPAGGGNRYNQTAISKGFIAVTPRTGHKQKANIKPIKN